jgi:hypothetical protein
MQHPQSVTITLLPWNNTTQFDVGASGLLIVSEVP